MKRATAPRVSRASRGEGAWVDSHCHLQSIEDAEGAVARARDAGVAWMVCVGTDLATSRQAVELARNHPEIRATVGLHPHDASRFAEEWEALTTLAADPAVVAVGETGFDLHYEHSPLADQEEAFRAHVHLARDLDLAVVVHSRDAWDATFAVLDESTPERAVVHCFTGGPDEARRALDLGALISFSGIVTFKDAVDVRAAVALVPLDRLLVETDAPYLAPAPHRGRPNEPALVGVVGEAVAAAAHRNAVDVATATAATAAMTFDRVAREGSLR